MVAKADYPRAKAHWKRQERIADETENAANVVAGGAGLTLGAASARDRYLKSGTPASRRMVLRTTALPAKVANTLTHGKPGVGLIMAGSGAGVVSLAAGQRRKYAERKGQKYASQPNASLAKAEAVTPVELQRRKKVQGVMGTAAATIGLTAFGAKSGAKLLPKIVRGGTKGKAYARHLDRSADSILFAGAGVGGATGLHQGSLYRQDAKQKLAKPVAPKPAPTKSVIKAFDSERDRHKRLKAYEGAAATGAIGAGVAAARPNKAVDFTAGAKMQRQGAVKFNQGAAESTYASNFKGGQRAQAAERSGAKMVEGAQLAARGTKRRVALRSTRVPGKQRLALAGAAVASGAGAAAVRRHRNGDGKSYGSWFDRAKSNKQPKPSRSPVSSQGRPERIRALEGRTRLPGKPPPTELNDAQVAAWRRSVR